MFRKILNIPRLLRSYLLGWSWQFIRSRDPAAVRRVRLCGGAVLYIPLNTAVGRCLFERRFETEEQAFMKENLRPGMTVVDVGANVGLYSVLAAIAVGPSGRVVAFEPSTRELEFLRKNIEANRLTNITIVPCAVAEKSGTTSFAISKDGGLNSMRQTNHPAQQIESWDTVHVTTIDETLASLGISHIDFLKIDVEGAERMVLQGASGTIAMSPGLITLFEAADSTSAPFHYSAKQLLAELTAQGWVIKRLDGGGRLVSVDPSTRQVGSDWVNFIGLRKQRQS